MLIIIARPFGLAYFTLVPLVKLNWNRIISDLEKVLEIRDLEEASQQDKLDL